jgi:hypothetical protein
MALDQHRVRLDVSVEDRGDHGGVGISPHVVRTARPPWRVTAIRIP